MKLSLGHRYKLSAGLPVAHNQYSLHPVRQQFDQLKAQIAAGWQIEHRPDGTHGDVTAGDVTAEDVTADSILSSQYKFPATQVPSSDAHTLDDYEEGTWTPAITGETSGTGQTYSAQDGRYVKIGRLVAVWFDVRLTAAGTLVGNIFITGLPVGVYASGNEKYVGACVIQLLATTWVSHTVQATIGSQTVSVRGRSAAATSDEALAPADIGNTTTIYGTLVYEASA